MFVYYYFGNYIGLSDTTFTLSTKTNFGCIKRFACVYMERNRIYDSFSEFFMSENEKKWYSCIKAWAHARI